MHLRYRLTRGPRSLLSMKIFDPNAKAPKRRLTGFAIGRRLGMTVLAVYWLLLVLGTHLPRLPRADLLSSDIDKVCHFLAYSGLAFLCALAWFIARSASRPLNIWHFVIIVVGLATYGVIDEVTQPWVGRSCELGDWVADLSGAAFGVVCFSAARSLSRWFAPGFFRRADRFAL
jgi:VanZ family protein